MKINFLSLFVVAVFLFQSASGLASGQGSSFSAPSSSKSNSLGVETRYTLSNGSPLFYEQNADVPRDILFLSFEGGPSGLTVEEQGIVLLFKEALEAGPVGLEKAEFNKSLMRLGVEFNFYNGSNVFHILMKTPREEFNKALKLLSELISSPKLTEADFNESLSKTTENLKAQFEDMRQTLFYFAKRDAFQYAPITANGSTSVQSLKKITYSVFKEKVSKILDFSKMNAAFVGSLKAADVSALLNTTFSEKLAPAKYIRPLELPRVALKQTPQNVVLIDKPGATDNQIAFVFRTDVRKDSVEQLKSQIAFDLLGGVHGKLSQTLRTERGLTYAARSRVDPTLPFWMVWTFGGDEQTAGLLKGVPEVLAAFKNLKPTKTMIEESKGRLLNDYLTGNELIADRLSHRVEYFLDRLNFRFHEDYEKNLSLVSASDISHFIRKLEVNKPLIYVMGDREKLLKTLQKVGIAASQIQVVKLSDIR